MLINSQLGNCRRFAGEWKVFNGHRSRGLGVEKRLVGGSYLSGWKGKRERINYRHLTRPPGSRKTLGDYRGEEIESDRKLGGGLISGLTVKRFPRAFPRDKELFQARDGYARGGLKAAANRMIFRIGTVHLAPVHTSDATSKLCRASPR